MTINSTNSNSLVRITKNKKTTKYKDLFIAKIVYLICLGESLPSTI